MNPKIVVPILVLSLKIILKLFVGRRVETRNYFELLYEFPTDIAFLSLSFSFVYFFLEDVTLKETALIPFIIIIISVIIVVIFRECRIIGDGNRTGWKIALLVLLITFNYGLSVTCLYYTSSNLLVKKAEITNTSCK